MRLFIDDLDDSVVNTTKDLRGDPKRIPHLTLVEGALEFLIRHQKRSILLTAGIAAEQNQKIDVLGIRGYFKKIIIVRNPEDKKEKLRELVQAVRFDPAYVTVIGDRLDVEIRAGNELGCATVRIQLPDGRHSGMMPRGAVNEIPHYTVSSFVELLQLFP